MYSLVTVFYTWFLLDVCHAQISHIQFLERPTNVSTVTGSHFILRCTATRNAYPTWTKDNRFVSTSNAYTEGRMFLLQSNHLLVVNADMTDSGIYTCRLSDGFSLIEARAWVDVTESDVPSESSGYGECGIARARGRIVGGRATKRGEWPWMAMLFDTTRNKHFCGGALLNRKWVITAAHCIALTYVTETTLQVHLGKYNADEVEEEQRVYEVDEIILHPEYDLGSYDADIALIRLSQRVAYTDYVIPVCVPSAETAENMLQAGKAGMVIGWGKTEEEFEGQPNLLREVRLTVRDHNNCGEDHSNTVTNNMFCAGPPPGQEGRDACQGDSGGPYMKKSGDRWYLLGLVSWGVGCARPDLPGVYTTIHRFHDWVTATASDGEESCINTEENYLEEIRLKELEIEELESALAEMSGEIGQIRQELDTCRAGRSGGENPRPTPEPVEQEERISCSHGYCPGASTTKAVCINGYCQCLSASYHTYTCLPLVGGCTIKKNSDISAASATLSGNERETYSCLNRDNDNYEVHTIGVYEALVGRQAGQHTPGESTVTLQTVTQPGKPIILFLVSYEPVDWIIEIPDAVIIDQVILISYYISDTTLRSEGGVIRSTEKLSYSNETPYGYGTDTGGGNTANLLMYINNRFGPVTSFTGTYKANEWSLSIGQLPPGVRSAPVSVDKNQWTLYAFEYDDRWTDCHGDQYVRMTSYDIGRYVGVVLCTSDKYKILLADDLEEEFLNIGDISGTGKDHCEFVGGNDDIVANVFTGNIFQAPLTPGFYRSERGETPTYGFIGGGVATTWTGRHSARAYECGVSIP